MTPRSVSSSALTLRWPRKSVSFVTVVGNRLTRFSTAATRLSLIWAPLNSVCTSDKRKKEMKRKERGIEMLFIDVIVLIAPENTVWICLRVKSIFNEKAARTHEPNRADRYLLPRREKSSLDCHREIPPQLTGWRPQNISGHRSGRSPLYTSQKKQKQNSMCVCVCVHVMIMIMSLLQHPPLKNYIKLN